MEGFFARPWIIKNYISIVISSFALKDHYFFEITLFSGIFVRLRGYFYYYSTPIYDFKRRI